MTGVDIDVDAILRGDDVPREEVNLIRLYESFCKEEGCRVNSALLRYMEDRGGTCSLERLLLNGNYLGPRGLAPVVRLIPFCQTLTTIDLENNGANNDTVAALCDVLETHMSVTWVSLRGNPITVPGGKRLLQLLERNPRITHLDISKSDILEALQERIRLAVLANMHRNEHGAPSLQPGSDSTLEGQARADGYQRLTSGSAAMLPSLQGRGSTGATKATFEPITVSKSPSAAIATSPAAPAAPARQRADGSPSLPRVAPASASATVHGQAEVTQPQPRPPIPALASRHSSRLPPNQLKSMRAVFAARAKLADEANRSDVSRAANTARTELQALEMYSALASGGSHGEAASTTRTTATPDMPAEQESVTSFDDLSSGQVGGTMPLPAHGRGRIQVMATAPALGTGGFAFVGEGQSKPTGSPSAHPAEAATTSSMVPAPTGSIFSPRVQTQPTPTAPARARRGLEVKEPEEEADRLSANSPGSSRALAVVPTTVEEMLDPAFMAQKTSEEQFQLLFDQGCREYAHRNLDTAYMAWNEAMSIAVRKKNREWMAVVSSNLQRLSYELLVNEGVTHLENGELEEADGAFGMAEELAVKVRNATWESEMQAARKRVLRAVFQRSHEAALVLFERTRQLQAPALTEDDYFVLPGTDLMVQHTAPFVEEWSRMLLIQEALGMWAEALKVAQRVGGAQAIVLQNIVEEALNSVAGYLARRYFDVVEPDALSWQGTSRYHYFECIMLTELWSSVLTTMNQSTQHTRLAAVAAAQLGHLYLATNQLAPAGRQFEHLVALGGQVGDAFIEGIGLAFSGILQYQRANHAVAERHLVSSVRKLEEVRTGLERELARNGATGAASPLANTGHTNATARPTNAAAAGDMPVEGEQGEEGHTSFWRALPLGCVPAILNACNRYRVCVMTSTYRYREAIEALEGALIRQYQDVLFHKLVQNFAPTPTLEEIVAVAHRVESPLVYFALHKRYDWNDDKSSFAVEDILCIWLVPRDSDMRFVELNVTKDFKTTVSALLQQVRRGLHLDPLQEEGVADAIFTTTHSRSWIPALQQLHAIFMEAVMDFIATLDRPVEHECRVITLIPTGSLWSIPFNVLMDRRKENRYLIEDAALQLTFSATHCAMASLNAQRVRERDLRRDVVVVQPEADPAAAQFVHVLFPFDPLRSVKEGASVAMALKEGPATASSATAGTNTVSSTLSGTELRNSCVVVSEREDVLSLLPRARLVHLSGATTCGEDRGAHGLTYALDGTPSTRNAGAVCLVSHGDVVLLHAADVAHMELAAEAVVLTNTNMSPELLRGTNDDALGLVRAMSSSGVPCVVAGQWCTPDMAPMHLFVKFYTLLSYGRDAAKTAKANPPHESPAADEVDATQLMRHKAISLACAMRSLMAEDNMRYDPRAWAGYYCIGHGFM